jgi:hypothetical protein
MLAVLRQVEQQLLLTSTVTTSYIASVSNLEKLSVMYGMSGKLTVQVQLLLEL